MGHGTTHFFLLWVLLLILENRETPSHRTSAQETFAVPLFSDGLFEHFGGSLQFLPSSISLFMWFK